MEQIPPGSLDSLKSEHLKEGIEPIMVSFGLPTDPIIQERIEKLSRKVEIPGVHNLDYDEEWTELVRKGFRNGGTKTYIISGLDDKDKYSGGMFNCTGIVATARDKNNQQNISFASHQDPSILDRKNGQFKADFVAELSELKERGELNTIDIVIVGGVYTPNSDFEEMYLGSIKLLTEQVKKIFGFEPVIIGGPKTKTGLDGMYYDNEHRRLYLSRTGKSKFHPDFTNRMVDEEKGGWPNE